MIPYGRQTIEDDDIAAVVEVLKAPLLTTGPMVERYEQAFAEAVGTRHAVACNSGTSALHLACEAAGLGPGTVAIVPSITFVATANAVLMTGASVAFADVDPDTGLMTEETLVEASLNAAMEVGEATFVLPVDLNGRRCAAMDEITKRVSDVVVIRDACHSLGSGESFANEVACFSTHPLKSITTGEGGMVATDDKDIAAYMRYMRSHGMTPNHTMFMMGYNYRLPDILCALGFNQLGKLQRFIQRRKEIAALYTELLSPLKGSGIRPVPDTGVSNAWHLYVILVDKSRDMLRTYLQAFGVGTQIHYHPVHKQPYYQSSLSLPGADSYASRCLSLPIYPTLTDEQVKATVGLITDWAATQKEAAA